MNIDQIAEEAANDIIEYKERGYLEISLCERIIKAAIEKAYVIGKQEQLLYDKSVEQCMKE